MGRSNIQDAGGWGWVCVDVCVCVCSWVGGKNQQHLGLWVVGIVLAGSGCVAQRRHSFVS
jgi:hypothetical protein